MVLNLRSLIGKLNDPTRNAMEAAAGLCLSRTHYDVEVEHFLLKLLDASDTDFTYIARQYEIDKSRLATELTRSIDRFKSGNARTPALSPYVLKMLTEAWTLGSIDYGAAKVRTGLAILALLTNDELSRMVRDFSRELGKIPPDGLRKDFLQITAQSRENAPATSAAGTGEPAAADAPPRARRRQDSQSRSVHRQPDRERPHRKDRSGAGSRFRDPPGGRHSDAEAAEQSDPGGRSRRGQDRRGGRLRFADRAGRCSAGAEERDRAHPGPGAFAGGRGSEGRVREPAEGADRGGEILAHANHSLYRRGAHHDRRGRAGGTERRRQPAETGAGARRTAHHRRHHLVRVQEVLRERPGAGAAFPTGESGRAFRGAVRADAARRRHHAGESPQRAHPGRRPAGGGEAFASLSARPAVAGQSGERSGYGLRAAGAGTERHPARHRRRHPHAGRPGGAVRAFWSANRR